MENAVLSSSYPSAYRSSVLDDVTKSRLDGDALAESWSLSAIRGGSERLEEEEVEESALEVPIVVSTQTVTSNTGVAGDLHSLAWLQKDCILNIAPLDSEDVALHSHEVVVTADAYSSSPERMSSPHSSAAAVTASASTAVTVASTVALSSGSNGIQQTHHHHHNHHQLSNSLSSLQSLSSVRSQQHHHNHHHSLHSSLNLNGGSDTPSYKSSENASLSASLSDVSLRHSHGSHVYSSLLASHHSGGGVNNGTDTGGVQQARQLSASAGGASSATGGTGGAASEGTTVYPPSIVGTRRPPKPAYSYTHLIFMAIESTLHKCMTVNEIYNWCETHFPYFKSAGAGWKNSLRHNLSINKCFKRIPRDGRADSSMMPSTSADPQTRGSASNIVVVDHASTLDHDDSNDDENEGPGRGAFWTVESKERAQLLEAVRRNPWTFNTALTVHNGNTPSPSLHHHTPNTYRTTGLIPQLTAATLLDVSYGGGVGGSGQRPTSGFQLATTASCSTGVTLGGGGTVGLATTVTSGGVVVDGGSTTSGIVDEDIEAKQYASLLRSLQNASVEQQQNQHATLSNSKTNGYHHNYHPYSRSKRDADRIRNGSLRNSPSSDTEFSDARLPSRTEMPLLHKTMKKMLLGHKKSQSDNDSDSQMTERDMQGVMDLVNLQNSAVGSESSVGEREKCNECKENEQGCEACLARGKRTTCYVTPAPSLDHEYARFQSVLRPRLLGEVDASEPLDSRQHHRSSTASTGPSLHHHRHGHQFLSSITSSASTSRRKQHQHRRHHHHNNHSQKHTSSSNSTATTLVAPLSSTTAAALTLSVKKEPVSSAMAVDEGEEAEDEAGSSSSDEDGEEIDEEDCDDRTEPMSQPAYLADLEEMSDSDSEAEDDENTQKSAAQILVEFSRLKRFQQQSGYWTSSSSPDKSVSDN